MKFVLFSNSETQRVTINIDKDCVLISKEWRKSGNQSWNIGKGITIPRGHFTILGSVLSCKSDVDMERILADNRCEVLKEE